MSALAARPERAVDDLARLSDSDLVGAFRAGNAAAFEELHRRYREELLHVLRRRLGRPDLAEDLAQETFLRAARAIHSPGAMFFVAWLRRIATNLCLDHFRAQRRRPTPLPLGPSVGPRSATLDTELEVTRREMAREVWRCLAQLSPRQRAALVLREIEGLDYRSIAAHLGLSVPAVEALLFRARSRMRQLLGLTGADAGAGASRPPAQSEDGAHAGRRPSLSRSVPRRNGG